MKPLSKAGTWTGILAAMALVVYIMMTAGCATTTGTVAAQPDYMKILTAADDIYDVAMTGCAAAYTNHLIGDIGKAKCISLGNYYVTARAQAVAAIAAYDASKLDTDLQKITYFVTYAEGIAANIVAAYNTAKAGA